MGLYYPVMEYNIKTVVAQSCRTLLRPIAKMLLKCGMTWKEFSNLSKSVYIEVASSEFGIKGRPTNVSRVSILTGVSRKEVKRQRDLLVSDQPAESQKTTDASRVLSAWHQDDAYRDADGEPCLLAEEGQAPSFASLFKAHGGDTSLQAMLKELLKTDAVERTCDGRLRAKSRFYRPAVMDPKNLRWAMELISDLGETMDNNVFLGKNGVPRFGRNADNDRMPASAVPLFRAFLDQRGQTFLEDIDDWLTDHAIDEKSQGEAAVRIGVGVFGIHD